jgi:hypothetical protein
MAVNLSPLAGAGWQFFTDSGVPLAGGKLYTYAAGTTTPETTYTSNTGLTANANPIILNSAGRLASDVWLTSAVNYKFVLATSTNVTIGTYDNISGIEGNVLASLANTSNNALGDALVGFRQSTSAGFMAGATAGTVNSKLQESVSVKDFGATGNGSTDDTNAFNLAHTAAQAINAAVYAPGTAAGYKIAGTIIAKASMYGDGFNTNLITSSATANVITCAVAGVLLSDFQITTTVTRTAGYYVSTSGASYFRIERVDMFNWFNCVNIGGAGVTFLRIKDSFWNTITSGGTALTVNTSTPCVDHVFQNVLIGGPATGAQCLGGVLINIAGDITLDHVSTVKCGTGLNLAPGTGQTIQAIYVTDSLFDSGSGTGVQFNMTGTGSIQLAKFTNVWSCTNANGFVLGATASGTCLRAEFINCTGSNNTTHGFIVNYSGVTNTSVIGGSYANNTNGLYFASGVELFSVIGVRAGLSGQFGNNSQYGLVLTGSNDKFTITNCDFTINTVGAASIGAPSGTPGQTFFIKNNQGIVTQNQSQVTLTSAATTTLVTHGLATTPRIEDIKITNNSGYGTAGQFFVTAPTSTQFTITTASNPGAGVLVSWDARVWGS